MNLKPIEYQKRKDASILGELMFNEAFIRENFLITDDKNNSKNITDEMLKLRGNMLSVSDFEKYKDGTFEGGTASSDKRKISQFEKAYEKNLLLVGHHRALYDGTDC